MTDISGTTNTTRPYVPGAGDTNANPAPTVAAIPSIVPPNYGQLPASPTGQQTACASVNGTTYTVPTDSAGNISNAIATDVALLSLLQDDTHFSENCLNTLRNTAYHFRLFLTTEHELVTGSTTGDIASVYNTLDALPKAIIAESGVTAGFNITDVEFDTATGPGWRNKNSFMQNLKITITESQSVSLLEAMLNSSVALGVSNFNKVWYYLELTFRGYDDDGTVDLTPLKGLQFPNQGRWIYQIALTDIAMHMSEGGATYTISAVPYSMTAFDDTTLGRTPDIIVANGNTIQGFLDNFATNLTEAWKKRYLGQIYTFNFKVQPIPDTLGTGQALNPGAFKLQKTDFDNQRNLTMDLTDGRIPTAKIPADTSISDIVMFLYSYCEEAQKMILDTNNPTETEDTNSDSSTSSTGNINSSATAKYNNKDYRVPIIPMVEADVSVTGYDPITGQYMKNITYTIWGCRTYKPNITSQQASNIINNKNLPATIATDLLNRGYLRKRYYYMFTGLNTEVLKLNLDYNLQYVALLPKMTGWRNDIDSNTHQVKVNPQILKQGGSYEKAPNSTKADPESLNAASSGAIQNNGQQQQLTAAQVNDILKSTSTQQTNLEAIINDPTSTADQVKTAKALLAQVSTTQSLASVQAQQIRQQFQQSTALQQQKIEQNLNGTNLYAEDSITNQNSFFAMTYLQAHSQAPDGAGMDGQWHRGSSLVGAIMNQLYAPVSSSLIQIEIEIKGDPYWIGASNIERRLTQAGSNPVPQASPYYPNIVEGDATFAVLFRFPSGVDSTGVPIIRNTDIFNGVYRAVGVKNVFSGGVFKQVLTAQRLELITDLTQVNNAGQQQNNQTTPTNNYVPTS